MSRHAAYLLRENAPIEDRFGGAQTPPPSPCKSRDISPRRRTRRLAQSLLYKMSSIVANASPTPLSRIANVTTPSLGSRNSSSSPNASLTAPARSMNSATAPPSREPKTPTTSLRTKSPPSLLKSQDISRVNVQHTLSRYRIARLSAVKRPHAPFERLRVLVAATAPRARSRRLRASSRPPSMTSSARTTAPRVSRRRASTRAQSPTTRARASLVRRARVARAPPDRRFRRRASSRVVVDAETFDFARIHRADDAISPPALAAQTRKRAPSFRPARLPRPASRARVAHSRRAPRATRARRSPRARARPTDRLHVFPRAKRPSKWNQNRRTPIVSRDGVRDAAEYGVRDARRALNSRVPRVESRPVAGARAPRPL